MKIVINKCFGGFSLSKEAYDFLGLEWGETEKFCKNGYAFSDDRTNPKLVECIEKLGEKANGQYSKLAVIEIPDNIDWYIDDYDGYESVEEKHRSWS